MKVVALVSGGKDSCYAMMKCIEYGHEIVALANLIPEDDSVDELDSYMYQTVGHQLVGCFGECMGLPLFRRRIKGSSRQCKLNYTETVGDEVEDLYVLLRAVKRQIPSITAVSSGAIASDYQRLRVESVCSRLGLVSLAYLWKQDQSILLNEMISNGIAAITVKVASMGLVPEKHLGKDIADLESHLQKLNELYGVNVCGEGGEYETLTLDCPLFCNAKIILDRFEIISHSSDSIAPVGVLHPIEFHLEKKQSAVTRTCVVSELEEDCDDYFLTANGNSSISGVLDLVGSIQTNSRKIFSICSPSETSHSSGNLEEDLLLSMGKMETHLSKLGYNWSHVLYMHLFINNMNEFSKANDIYVKFITQQRCPFGVPSRSTVELPISNGSVLVEALVAKDHCKDVLHVQSISSWAPSCIGPYSQATMHKGLLHMAGQLGLDPSTMSLSGFDATAEIEQSLRNCEAVANSFDLSVSTSSIQITVYCSRLMPLPIRERIHEKIVSLLKISEKKPSHEPMFLYLLVSDLPKRALVELKPILSASNEFEKMDGQKIVSNTTPFFEAADWHASCVQSCVVNKKTCAFVLCLTKELAFNVCGAVLNIEKLSKFCVHLLHKLITDSGFVWEDVMSLRVYFPSSAEMSVENLSCGFDDALKEESDVAAEVTVTVVPVLAVGRCPLLDSLLTCELIATKC